MTLIPHLYGKFFQLGYVTRNLDASVKVFSEKYGPTEFRIMDMPARADGTESPTKRIALAYIDDVQIELIQPSTTVPTIYDELRPETDGPIAFHHICFEVDDMEGTVESLRALGYAIPMVGEVPGHIGYCYADSRADLGHYCEFVRLHEGGRKMMDSVPRNLSRR